MSAASAGGPILALEASTLQASAALLDGAGGVLAAWTQAPGARGTAPLAAAAADLLGQAGVAPRELAGVVVGTGPGSYTGLRASIALARGLALGAELPVAGVPSVAALARAALRGRPDAARVVVLVDARREQVYRADYDRGPHGAPAERRAPHLRPAAEALADADEALVVRDGVPSAADLGELGRVRLARGGDPPAAIVPLYLKRSHAEIQLEQRAARGGPARA